MSKFFNRLFAPSVIREERERAYDADYARAIERTAQMVGESKARGMAKKHGLQILDLTWEDTGRYKGSCVGPNISDMTIQVQNDEQVTCMPVIRYPNFSDKTCDVSIDDIKLRVGNEKGKSLKNVSLREYLRDLREHLSEPQSWSGKETSLLSPREQEVLVSAQACFLPVPKGENAEFNPVLFNYQSYAGEPAVLAIVATREGTSATIIDNERDGFAAGSAWGQRLFFNQDGERASFTGTRISDFVEAGGDQTDKVSDIDSAKAAGLNCVMLIQVPLVQPQARMRASALGGADFDECSMSMAPCAEMCDVEEAVIGHGEVEGPFTEIDGLAIKRDARFPIRVTVQFYKATSTGVVSNEEMKAIAEQIDEIYRDAKAVGSLVVDVESGRSTEWDDEGKGKDEPKDWWESFWRTRERETKKTRDELMADLEALLGRRPRQSELEAALKKVFKV